jgi:hypothetical protein
MKPSQSLNLINGQILLSASALSGCGLAQTPQFGVCDFRRGVGGFQSTSGAERAFGRSQTLKDNVCASPPDMGIEFLYRLRDEIKFQNPAILKVQILEDARRSLKFFRLFRAFAQPRIGNPAPKRLTTEEA